MIRLRLVIRNTWVLSLYIFLLVCSVLMGSCSHNKQAEDLAIEKEQPKEIQEIVTTDKEPAEQITEAEVREKEPPPMIQIQNFSLTDKILTFDYRFSNPFKDDIRICQDICVYGNQHVATIIDAETVWIKLRFNIRKDKALRNPPVISKYLCLPPGKSSSGRILLNLPIRNASPINSFSEEDDKERKQIILRHVVFEVGYFGPNTNKVFDSISELMKEQGILKEFGIKPDITVLGGVHYLPFSPLTVKEIQDGRSCEVVYVDEHCELISAEESEKVVVNNVEIPCSIAVDDK